MNQVSPFIEYYKRCFERDNAPFQLLNFFGSKTNHTLQLSSNRLVDSEDSVYTPPTSWANKVFEHLKLYQKEKDLILGSLFLIGKTNRLGRSQKICAPLFYSKLKLIKPINDDGYELYTIDDSLQINIGFFNSFKDINPSVIAELLNPIKDTALINEEVLLKIQKALNSLNIPIDDSHLYHDATNIDLKKIQGKANEVFLVNKCAAAVCNKNYNTRGILIELNELINKVDINQQLIRLFNNQNSSTKVPQHKFHYAPANLSTNQKKILDGIESHHVNIVIGPPGTGKSYTIAAIATDAITKGRSVLISSKNNEAVDVILNKLELDFNLGDMPIRVGRQDYKKQIKKRIDDIINFNSRYFEPKIKKLRKSIHKQTKEVDYLKNNLEKKLERATKEGKLRSKENNSLLDKIQLAYFDIINTNNTTLQFDLSQLVKSEVSLEKDIQAFVKRYIYETRAAMGANDVRALRQLSKAFSSRTAKTRDKRFNAINWSIVNKYFPIWMLAAYDVHYSLPSNIMFDLLIIDEASQMEIATSLPLISRAKNVVIVGDPNQLRHLSFLSRAEEEKIRRTTFGYDQDLPTHRDNSILDYILEKSFDPKQIHFLDEHYRSYPSIINFSNQNFYNGNLSLMRHALATSATGLSIKVVNGKRSKNGSNKTEVEAIINRCKEIIEWEIASESKLSIGILSPFSKQVDALRKMIEANFSANQIQDHRILVGSPFSFQGEERDIMLLSFCIDESTTGSTLRYLSNPNVLNVSITRAKSIQEIYISTPVKSIKSGYLISEYLQSIDQSDNFSLRTLNDVQLDPFIQDVISFIQNIHAEFQIEIAQIIGGELIDILLQYGEKRMAIDLIGQPGDFSHPFHIEKIRMLRRIDIMTYLLPVVAWNKHTLKAGDRLKKAILEYFDL